MSKNFLEFINNDIDSKRSLITTLPTKTKTNRKKYTEELNSMIEKYEGYRKDLLKYLKAKSKSFELKKVEYRTEEIQNEIKELEYAISLLNPVNTSSEKMGFGVLVYQLQKTYLFNFGSLNDVITSFLNKFKAAGIELTPDDFTFTCYVHEYMSAFMEAVSGDEQSFKKVSEVFDRIYWVNPELIQHIELNFRKLIHKHSKTFNNYVSTLSNEVCARLNISDFDDAVRRLNVLYQEYYEDQKEDIYEIVEGAKNGLFDINQYLENSKVRQNAFATVIDSSVDYNDKEKMNKVCGTLESLKLNIMEYDNYNKFKVIFDAFGEKYKSLLGTDSKGYKGFSDILFKINSREKELDKIYRKLNSNGLFSKNIDKKALRVKSINIANEICELYSTYDDEYFKYNILEVLNDSLNVYDVLRLYRSFPYYKMNAIEEAFRSHDYDEILELATVFDDFALNPSNVIVSGIPIFGSVDVATVIANKYKLHDLQIEELDLAPDDTATLLDKILLILRVNCINNSDIDITKIWFMTKVFKIQKSLDDKK